MTYKLVFISFMIVQLAGISAGFAQKSTEVYIPIGASPGLSGEYTTIGTVHSLDEGQGMLTISDSTGMTTMRVVDETWYYLDKSEIGQQNLRGALSDCLVGRLVEVKYMKSEPNENAIAEWIKIQIK